MLKLVGTNKDGSVADEKVLITDEGKPTKFLVGIALLELACDVTIAIGLARIIARSRKRKA